MSPAHFTPVAGPGGGSAGQDSEFFVTAASAWKEQGKQNTTW